MHTLYLTADFLTKLQESGIRGIKGSALFQRMNALFPNMPRGIKVRLTDTKGDCILHFRNQIKKLSYSARLNRKNLRI